MPYFRVDVVQKLTYKDYSYFKADNEEDIAAFMHNEISTGQVCTWSNMMLVYNEDKEHAQYTYMVTELPDMPAEGVHVYLDASIAASIAELEEERAVLQAKLDQLDDRITNIQDGHVTLESMQGANTYL